jgi:cell division protein FtsQ
VKLRKSKYSKSVRKKIGSDLSLKRQFLGASVGIGGVVLGVFLLGWLCYTGLSHSTFFQIESVKISGCSRFEDGDILALAGINNRTNLVAVNEEKVVKTLTDTGWIRKVAVEKKYPNSLELNIVERKPIALVQLHDGLHYFDRQGVVFAAVELGDDLDYPVIYFVDETMLDGQGSLKNITDFLKYTRNGNPALSIQNISQIMVDEKGDMTMYMADNPFPVQIGQTKMWQKYKRLAKVLGWLYKKKKFKTVTAIDLEYLEGRVLVSFQS